MHGNLLDSNVLIKLIRREQRIENIFLGWHAQGTELFISVATRTEIIAGMHPIEEERTLRLLNSLVSLSVDDNIADQAGRWIYLYRRQGIQLALADTIIAATAWAHGLTLVTSNAKHFPMENVNVLAVNY
ncbi:MAG: type II toxin-antitoxin system VapC family toxin [Chloroflexi bacterium]|nr:type II toxin-antitoxin system VapC family toxin [Chloroflexota bacterium]